MPPKAILAHSELLIRKGLKALLQGRRAVNIIGEATSSSDTIELIQTRHPEVLLLGQVIDDLDGFGILEKLKKDKIPVKTINILMQDDKSHIANCIKVGANGFLSKNDGVDEIAIAVHQVMKKGYYLSESIGKVLFDNLAGNKHDIRNDVKFNQNEIQVLRLLAEEFSSHEIGKKLFKSRRTIDGIRSNLMHKAGVKNVTGLMVYGFRHGLLE